MRYYTWDGMKLFRSVKSAAKYAVKHGLNPYSARILQHGKLQMPFDHEYDELWETIHGLPLLHN